MNHLTLKSKALAVGTVGLMALTAAGCGSSSHKSSSVQSSGGQSSSVQSSSVQSSGGGSTATVNAACVSASSTIGSVYETVGERYLASTSAWGAGTTAGKAVAVSQLVSALQTVKAPSGQEANYKTLLSLSEQDRNLLQQEEAAAKKGDQSGFGSLEQRRAAINNQSDKLSLRLGLPACAGKAVSSADQAQITHVIVHSATAGDPAECTQAFTAAFIKQSFGTMAKCVSDQKRPTSHPTSVDVSNFRGAGDYAYAAAIAHFASGKTQKLSFALLRQNGSWRLLQRLS